MGTAPSQRRLQLETQAWRVAGGAMSMGGWADDADWAPLAEGIAEAVSEAVSDRFSEYVRASMLSDLSDVRVGQGGRGVRRAGGVVGLDRLVFSRLKPTG